MKWLDFLIGKHSPQRISRYFKILAAMQFVSFLFHLNMTFLPFRLYHKGWGWKHPIKLSVSDADGALNKRYQLSDNVEMLPTSSDVIFNFPSFEAWINSYTISFFIVDTLKWSITIFALLQLSKAMSYKINFVGFSTEGVKCLRYAGLPIMFIPILDIILNRIFMSYAATQSTYFGFSKFPSAYSLYEPLIAWYYIYAGLILLGLAEIFRYGMQLKEETDLTV